MNPIVSEQYEFVIGVDTHAATHTFALVGWARPARCWITRCSRPMRLGCPGLRAGWSGASAAPGRWWSSRAPARSGRSLTERLQEPDARLSRRRRCPQVIGTAPARATNSMQYGSPGRSWDCR